VLAVQKFISELLLRFEIGNSESKKDGIHTLLILTNVTLRYVTLCYVMLCYVMLCYVMLCYVLQFLQYNYSR
jgi:hypothetical protein